MEINSKKGDNAEVALRLIFINMSLNSKQTSKLRIKKNKKKNKKKRLMKHEAVAIRMPKVTIILFSDCGFEC